METRFCKATSLSGKPCKNNALAGRDYCLAHDKSPDSVAKFLKITSKGGKKPRTLIGKLKGFQAKDSVDFAEGVRRILEIMLSQGLIKNTRDVSVFNGLVGTYIKLEQSAVLPKKMREIEAKLAEANKKLTDN